jgi:hypothetical protein
MGLMRTIRGLAGEQSLLSTHPNKGVRIGPQQVEESALDPNKLGSPHWPPVSRGVRIGVPNLLGVFRQKPDFQQDTGFKMRIADSFAGSWICVYNYLGWFTG